MIRLINAIIMIAIFLLAYIGLKYITDTDNFIMLVVYSASLVAAILYILVSVYVKGYKEGIYRVLKYAYDEDREAFNKLYSSLEHKHRVNKILDDYKDDFGD